MDFFVVTYRDQAQMLGLSAYAPTPAIFVRGGAERQDSVAAALAELPDDISHVFIHDCARPLVREEQLAALYQIVRKENAVVLAHRVTDTIKEHIVGATRAGEEHVRLRTLDRSRLWAMIPSASEILRSGSIVTGSTIMPLSLRFTRSTSSACRSMDILR